MSSNQILHSLDKKSREPATMERAGLLLSKAKLIQELSADAFNYIEGLKKTITITTEAENDLFARLMKYKEDILAVDSSIREEFASNLNFISRPFDSAKLMANDFIKTFFRNTTPLLTSAMLAKLQNNIKIIENKTITYCLNKIGSTDGEGFLEYFSAIVGQNSKIFKPGDLLEIKAGMGAFSKATRPTIIINGNQIPLEGEGYSLYKIQVSGNPGKYKVPLRIKYFNQVTGKETEVDYNVEYTVTKPCDQ
jgi:hypothetical protein